MPVRLVRHTKPLVEDGICYGRTDLDVASSFQTEADKVLARLPRPEIVVSSPLRRCWRLAEHIASAFELPVQLDQRVQEMDFGRWENTPWANVPRSELDAWSADFLHARPHGGESVAMLLARVTDALSEYQASEQEHIIVTHAGVIKAALADGDEASHFASNVDFGAIVGLSADNISRSPT